MTNRKIKMLKDIIMFEQNQLHKYISTYLSYFYEPDAIIENDGSFIFVEGDIPVVLVAHLDTVHARAPKEEEIFYDEQKQVMWSPVGIGADCRAGVFNILDIIAQGYKPSIAFCWDEEVGGVGAHALAAMVSPQGLNFAIEFDRRGESQAVYYDCGNQDFEDYISGFGYRTEWGSYSDICELCPAWDIAGVNLSAGYLNEHTNQELLLFHELLNSQAKVINILKDQMENPKHYDFQEVKAYGYSSSAYGTAGRGWEKYNYTPSAGTDPFAQEHSNVRWDSDMDGKREDIRETCQGCKLKHQWYHMCGVENYEGYCDTCYQMIQSGVEPTPLVERENEEQFLPGDHVKCPYCDEDVFYDHEMGAFCSNWCQEQMSVAYQSED